jgi:hypothetical protein
MVRETARPQAAHSSRRRRQTLSATARTARFAIAAEIGSLAPRSDLADNSLDAVKLTFMPAEPDNPPRPVPRLHPPEFYLSRMGGIWLSMVVVFTAWMILWFGVGLAIPGLIVGVVPLIVLRGRWGGLMSSYSASMRQSGKEPFSIRDWSLVSESLVQFIQPTREARSRTPSS